MIDRLPPKQWFLNEGWTPTVEKKFFEKLKRAKKKDQYLTIQAACLAATHPHVALDLLRKYFELHDPWNRARAYQVQGQAFTALKELDAAVDSFEKALEEEKKKPNVLTDAYLDMAILVSVNGMSEHYDSVLTMVHKRKKRIAFPSMAFMHNASIALILAARGDLQSCRPFAAAALDMAARTHSGFSRHPQVGLLRIDEWRPLIERLSALIKDRVC